MEARSRGPVVRTQSQNQSVFVGLDGVGAHINPGRSDDPRDDDPLTTPRSPTFATADTANNLVEPLLALADQVIEIGWTIVASHLSLNSSFEPAPAGFSSCSSATRSLGSEAALIRYLASGSRLTIVKSSWPARAPKGAPAYFTDWPTRNL